MLARSSPFPTLLRFLFKFKLKVPPALVAGSIVLISALITRWLRPWFEPRSYYDTCCVRFFVVICSTKSLIILPGGREGSYLQSSPLTFLFKSLHINFTWLQSNVCPVLFSTDCRGSTSFKCSEIHPTVSVKLSFTDLSAARIAWSSVCRSENRGN